MRPHGCIAVETEIVHEGRVRGRRGDEPVGDVELHVVHPGPVVVLVLHPHALRDLGVVVVIGQLNTGHGDRLVELVHHRAVEVVASQVGTVNAIEQTARELFAAQRAGVFADVRGVAPVLIGEHALGHVHLRVAPLVAEEREAPGGAGLWRGVPVGVGQVGVGVQGRKGGGLGALERPSDVILEAQRVLWSDGHAENAFLRQHALETVGVAPVVPHPSRHGCQPEMQLSVRSGSDLDVLARVGQRDAHVRGGVAGLHARRSARERAVVLQRARIDRGGRQLTRLVEAVPRQHLDAIQFDSRLLQIALLREPGYRDDPREHLQVVERDVAALSDRHDESRGGSDWGPGAQRDLFVLFAHEELQRRGVGVRAHSDPRPHSRGHADR